jgi:four helix bundle protein
LTGAADNGGDVERSAFETLEVYRIAEDLADRIWSIVTRWDRLPRDTVGRQLIRAADSIGANIAEGHGRGSKIDHRRFLRISRGSINETKQWLRRAFRRKLLSDAEINALRPLRDVLAPKLNAYLRNLESSIRSKTSTGDEQPTTSDEYGHHPD